MEFKYNNRSIILYKENYESIDLFIERGNYIIRQSNYDLINNFDEVLKLSKIFVNNKIKKCKYKHFNKKI